MQPWTFTWKRPRQSRHFCILSILGAGFLVQKHTFHMNILLQVSINFWKGSAWKEKTQDASFSWPSVVHNQGHLLNCFGIEFGSRTMALPYIWFMTPLTFLLLCRRSIRPSSEWTILFFRLTMFKRPQISRCSILWESVDWGFTTSRSCKLDHCPWL